MVWLGHVRFVRLGWGKFRFGKAVKVWCAEVSQGLVSYGALWQLRYCTVGIGMVRLCMAGMDAKESIQGG